ncbi:hypothetical protein GGF31_007006 [Allomyces arbusculus]|nr:hypothetical protein GGF31_007006 [Allomyces arbusculus]
MTTLTIPSTLPSPLAVLARIDPTAAVAPRPASELLFPGPSLPATPIFATCLALNLAARSSLPDPAAALPISPCAAPSSTAYDTCLRSKCGEDADGYSLSALANASARTACGLRECAVEAWARASAVCVPLDTPVLVTAGVGIDEGGAGLTGETWDAYRMARAEWRTVLGICVPALPVGAACNPSLNAYDPDTGQLANGWTLPTTPNTSFLATPIPPPTTSVRLDPAPVLLREPIPSSARDPAPYLVDANLFTWSACSSGTNAITRLADPGASCSANRTCLLGPCVGSLCTEGLKTDRTLPRIAGVTPPTTTPAPGTSSFGLSSSNGTLWTLVALVAGVAALGLACLVMLDRCRRTRAQKWANEHALPNVDDAYGGRGLRDSMDDDYPRGRARDRRRASTSWWRNLVRGHRPSPTRRRRRSSSWSEPERTPSSWPAHWRAWAVKVPMVRSVLIPAHPPAAAAPTLTREFALHAADARMLDPVIPPPYYPTAEERFTDPLGLAAAQRAADADPLPRYAVVDDGGVTSAPPPRATAAHPRGGRLGRVPPERARAGSPRLAAALASEENEEAGTPLIAAAAAARVRARSMSPQAAHLPGVRARRGHPRSWTLDRATAAVAVAARRAHPRSWAPGEEAEEGGDEDEEGPCDALSPCARPASGVPSVPPVPRRVGGAGSAGRVRDTDAELC